MSLKNRWAGNKIQSDILNRPLSKLAAVKEVQGETARRTGVDTLVHEDSSTVSTQQFSTAVGFRKRSISEKLQLYNKTRIKLNPLSFR